MDFKVIKKYTAPVDSSGGVSVVDELGYVPENVANKSTDIAMGGDAPSDVLYSSQKAAKAYIDAHAGSGVLVGDGLIMRGDGSDTETITAGNGLREI